MDKKVQKKKDREKLVRKKILRRREAMRAAKKVEAQKESSYEKEYFARRADPTLTDDERNNMLEKLTGKSVKQLDPEEIQQRDAAIVIRLKKNIEMLEALEKQYVEEQESRERTNKILETEGAVSIKEKLDLLQKMQKQKLADAPEIEIVGS